MDRNDRLYALVEELRAASPRPRRAAWLARRFGVSARTIERDLEALRQSGVPIWSPGGRAGGYALDHDDALPPLALTPAEALAISVALRSVAGSPFTEATRSSWLKILATMPAGMRQREEMLAARLPRAGGRPRASSSGALIAAAIEQQRVLHLAYADRRGALTERDVEPLGLLWGPHGWYLLAWCRLRQGIRGFLLERIRAARLLPERAAGLGREELRQELSGRHSSAASALE